MEDTIKTFLNEGKLRSSFLAVKLIKEIDANSFIIADKSMVALLDTHEAPDHSKYLTCGNWYKLIKCQQDGKNTIKTNKLFKPVRTLIKYDIDGIDDQVQNFQNQIVADASVKKYEDFETLSKKQNHSKIDKLTVKVITMSRVIATNKGNYQICNIKDIYGNTTSINLYSNYLNRLEPFKIFTITNLRKGEVTKDSGKKMRLHTTGYTKIEDGSMEDSMNFQKIGNGEESITGTVIGFGDLSTYQSCRMHYKKLDDANNCPTCDKELIEAEMIKDFRSDIYIETQNLDDEETNVTQILMFKRALGIKPHEDPEEKLTSLAGKMAKIDYNSDDAGRFIAVSIQLME